MKFKDNEQYKMNDLYLESRYNKITDQEILKIEETQLQEEKITLVSSTIMSLMVIIGEYQNAQLQIEEKDINSIINKLFELSSIETQDKFEETIDFTNNKEIIFKDNERYLLVDSFKYKNENILCLINNNEYLFDIAIVKENNNKLQFIEEDSDFELIIQKIFIDLKENIKNLLD